MFLMLSFDPFLSQQPTLYSMVVLLIFRLGTINFCNVMSHIAVVFT